MSTITINDLHDAAPPALTRAAMRAIHGGSQLPTPGPVTPTVPVFPAGSAAGGVSAQVQSMFDDMFGPLGLGPATPPGAHCSNRTSVTGEGGDVALDTHCEASQTVS